MDPISKFMVDHKIPIGAWGKAFFGFLTDNFDTVFRAFSNGLNFLLDGLVGILLMVPPVLLALVIAVVAWLLQRSRPLAIGVFLGLIFIINQNLWKQTVQTLVLVVAAAAMAMAIGVPLGIWAAHKPKVYRVMLPVLDLMP
ncbi:choline ABC transporter permease subunit, partial [Mesorhizobium sp. M7A.F.Ca.CA.001.08.2.1]